MTPTLPKSLDWTEEDHAFWLDAFATIMERLIDTHLSLMSFIPDSAEKVEEISEFTAGHESVFESDIQLAARLADRVILEAQYRDAIQVPAPKVAKQKAKKVAKRKAAPKVKK
jgi:hypothetical protein